MHFLIDYVAPVFGWSLVLGVSALAFWKGGLEERLACGALLVGVALSRGLRDWSWSGTQWGAMSGDLMYLAVLIWIALRSRRFWPIWAAGFQLVNVLTHVGQMVDGGVLAWAYATAQVIFTWLGCFAIAVGVAAAWRDRAAARVRIHSSS